MTGTKEELLQSLRKDWSEMHRTESWKRRKDLRRHMERLQIRLDKLRTEEKKRNG